jgi:aldehyde:ferredoxin oxidoreductase
VLVVDLTTRTSRVEELDESVYQLYLGSACASAHLM